MLSGDDVAAPQVRPGAQLPGDGRVSRFQPLLGISARLLTPVQRLPRCAECGLRPLAVALSVADLAEVRAYFADVVPAHGGARLRGGAQIRSGVGGLAVTVEARAVCGLTATAGVPIDRAGQLGQSPLAELGLPGKLGDDGPGLRPAGLPLALDAVLVF